MPAGTARRCNCRAAARRRPHAGRPAASERRAMDGDERTMSIRLPLLGLRRRGFPYTKPAWPGGVEREPEKRELGIDFDTEWARRYPARLGRAMVLDTVGQAAVRALASPTIAGTDRLEHLKGPAVFAANHASHVDTPLLLTTLPERFRHRTAVAAGADYFFDKRWQGDMCA